MPSSPPSNSLARFVGASTALLVLLGLGGIGGFLVGEYRAKVPRVQVTFPAISTLSAGDAVVENGVAVGRVERITLDTERRAGAQGAGHGDGSGSGEPSGRAVVTLRLFHDAPLPEDSRFYNLSHSLMGARKVWLVRGTADARTRPLDRAQVQEGIFVPGLPETLHKVSALKVIISRLRAAADSLLTPQGDGMRALARLDSAHTSLARLTASLGDAESALREGLGGLESAAQAGDSATTGLRRARPQADSVSARARALLAAYREAERPLGQALISLERLTARAADTTGPTGRLLGDDRDYNTLVAALEKLDSINRVLRKGGLGDDMKIKARLKSKGE